MCNLYSMTRSREAMLRLFRVGDNRAAAVAPKPAIFPGYVAPIVRKAADGERELVKLNWGFVLLQKDRAPRRVTNVRDDKFSPARFGRRRFSSADASCRRPRIASPRARSRPRGIGSPSTGRRSARCLPSQACGRAIKDR